MCIYVDFVCSFCGRRGTTQCIEDLYDGCVFSDLYQLFTHTFLSIEKVWFRQFIITITYTVAEHKTKQSNSLML